MENQVNCCNYLFLKGHAINNHFQTRERPGDVIVSNSHIAIVDRIEEGFRTETNPVKAKPKVYLIESTWGNENQRRVINEHTWLYLESGGTDYSPRRLRP